MTRSRAGLQLAACVLALVITPIAVHAAPGTVKGRIVGQEKLVPDVYAEAAKPDSHRYTWREPSPTVDAKFRVAAANPSRDICLAAISTQTQGAHEAYGIRVTGGRATPSTIVVSPGTRLVFENVDPFPHKLYLASGGAASTFKPDPMPGGARRDFTAPGQGRLEFRDETTPSLRMWVVVDPQASEIAYPGRDGAFAFQLSPGDYVVRAFFQGKQVGKSLSVAVKDKQTFDLKDPLNVSEGGDGK